MSNSQLDLYGDYAAAGIETGGRKGQVRLSEISVYNWGSFSERIHTAPIDREGTLITGDNGSGKSTLIDGLMALLQAPGRASFNIAAAQGDKRDRNLVSYMRGSYGTSHDGAGTRVLNKRPKAVVTGLRAQYQFDGGSVVSLMAIFFIKDASNSYSDVNKLYFIADEDISLKTLLDAFSKSTMREFKRWVEQQVNLRCFDDRFSEYQTVYRQKLTMGNENAPALLARALGLKKIDDLTKLIRELVLEPGNIRELARDIVHEFADLLATHERLVDTRERVKHLQRLLPLHQALQEVEKLLAQLEQDKVGLPIFEAKQQVIALAERIHRLEEEMAALKEAMERLSAEEQTADAYTDQCYAAYLQLGGSQIEPLRQQLNALQERLGRMVRDSQRYQKLCRDLQLGHDLVGSVFRDNQRVANEQLRQAEFELPRLEEAFFANKQKVIEFDAEYRELSSLIHEMQQRPNSNIDIKYQQLRDRMVEELGIDEEKLVFIGELIDVAELELPWKGAIERALGQRKLNLLVPEADAKRVTRWLNQRHLGLNLSVELVGAVTQTVSSFEAGGFLEKLIWRDHAYQNWLKNHLSRFDLWCVDTVEELNRTPYSMTVEGLIHLKQGSFEKKDRHKVDDRRRWQLGFDAKAKLNLLLAQQQALQASLVTAKAQAEKSQQQRDDYREQSQWCQQLLTFDWDSIDVPRYEKEREELSKRLAALEDDQGDLQQAKIRWEEAKKAVVTIQKQKEAQNKKIGALENALKSAETQHAEKLPLAQEALDEVVQARLALRLDAYDESDRAAYYALSKALEREYAQVQNRQIKDKEAVASLLGGFRGREKWQPYTVDWVSGFEALYDALTYLEYLEKEGLPVLVEQYQERLNKNMTQSIALLYTNIEAEFADIRERISRINRVLSKTEFRPNSYLKLNPRRERYPAIQDFTQKMNLALSSMNDADQDKRFSLVNDVVSILKNALESSRVDDERLLDPRKQMSFYAEEIQLGTEQVLDVLDSSSGKSGGEKEAFAGTIVAASLAYVLTPKDEEYPVYATVFLDEAFSNAAEGVAARVIKVFKALKLHVNLITPYKNLNVAREAARSLILTERKAETHESRLREISWEQIDEQQAKRQRDLKQYAQSQGVQVYEP